MFDWLRRLKRPPARLKPVGIGDSNLTIDLPEPFTVEREDSKTTLVCYPDFQSATLRFTIHSLANEMDPEARNLGIQSVKDMAKKYNVHLLKYPEFSYFSHSGPAPKSMDSGKIFHWTVGFKNFVVVATVWISKDAQKDPAAQALLKSVEPAILTLHES